MRAFFYTNFVMFVLEQTGGKVKGPKIDLHNLNFHSLQSFVKLLGDYFVRMLVSRSTIRLFAVFLRSDGMTLGVSIMA